MAGREAAGRGAAVLRTLAEKLDVFQTLGQFPDLSAAELRRILLQAAGRMAEAEGQPQEPPVEGRRGEAGAFWELFADGASRGNPGPAGAGYVLVNPAGEVVSERAVPLGRATNNVAEYLGLVLGLEEALQRGVERLRVNMDSQLVVRQLSGLYRVKNPRLGELHAKVKQLLSKLAWHDIVHIERGANRAADALANQGAAALNV